MKAPQAIPFFPDPRNKELVVKVIQAVAWLFGAYEKAMQREKLLDFDDQKLRAYVSLLENPGLLHSIQSSYSEIIVDEFQDINRLDFVFIKAIAAKADLVVTGDDDQAIYGFRGCTPDFIIDLHQHLGRQVASYELQINYRCPANIVRHADRLIRHNKRRIEKNPIPHNEGESEIKVLPTLSAGLEAKAIVSMIRRIKRANSTLKYSDFAVLYRTNAQSLPLQVEFILNELPYYVREDDNILANKQLEKLLGVLRLKTALKEGRNPQPQDAVATVQSYFRFVRESDSGRMGRLFKENPDFMETISSDQFHAVLPKAEQSNFPAAMIELLEAKTLLDSLSVLSKRFHGLDGMIGSLEDVLEEKVPLGEIYEVAANFGGNIRDFIQMMEKALRRARETGAGRDKESGVGLLTYFKSKGLQWHTVILTTCNDGLIPHARAPLEDERRLFYVAMTRTSSNLVISYVKTSCNQKVMPSRFLREAGLL